MIFRMKLVIAYVLFLNGCIFCYAIFLAQKRKSEERRLRACGLDSYIIKEELQKALDFENKRALLLDAVNRARNTQVQRNWTNRGRKMGVINEQR